MSGEDSKEHFRRKEEERIREAIPHPELPVFHPGLRADSEGRTSFSPGWMNGYPEDVLKKIEPLAHGAYPSFEGAFDVSLTYWSIPDLVDYWGDGRDLPKITYVESQKDTINKRAAVSAGSEEKVEEFIKLLNPKTKFEIVPREWIVEKKLVIVYL